MNVKSTHIRQAEECLRDMEQGKTSEWDGVFLRFTCQKFHKKSTLTIAGGTFTTSND